MKTVKDKLYNFEQRPPEENWQKINSRLTGRKTVNIKTANAARKKTKVIALTSAAAAVIAIILISTVFSKKQENRITQKSNEASSVAGIRGDSARINFEALRAIIKTPKNKKLVTVKQISRTDNLKYITISGPGGEPVKISPKVATLIISAEGENPPRPTWSNEISKWQQIMLSNNITPTSANLMYIIQKASNSVE